MNSNKENHYAWLVRLLGALLKCVRVISRPAPALTCVSFLVLTFCIPVEAATVTIVPQTGNYNQERQSGSGAKGSYNSSGNSMGIYANSAADASEAFFQTLTTTGPGNTGSARTLHVGDVITNDIYSGASPVNRKGWVLRSSTTYSSFNDIDNNDEVKFQLDSSGGFKLFDSGYGSGSDSGLGAGADVSFEVTITSPSTYNAKVFRSGSTTWFYDRPWSGTAISSWGGFDVNDGGGNDTYFNTGMIQDSGVLTIGGANADLTISGVIPDGMPANATSGTTVNRLNKIGSAALTLSGANTYSGITQIQNGQVSISADSGLGTAPGSATAGQIDIWNTGSLKSTATFTLSSNRGITIGNTSSITNTFDVASGTTLTYGGIMTGGAEWYKAGAGTLFLSGNDSTITGKVSIKAGTLRIASTGGLGRITGTAPIANVWNTGTLEFTNTFTLTSSATLEIGNVDGPVFSVQDGSTITWGGVLSGNSAWSKQGPGTFVITATQTNTGALVISNGAVRISHANALGTTAGGTTVASGGALEIQGTITTAAEGLTLNGTGVSSGGALRNTANNNTYAGAITLGSAARINSDSGVLTLTGGITGSGIGLTVGGALDTTINSVVGTGSGTLTKDGAGTLILSSAASANTYTGLTTVNAGTLRLGKNATVNAFGGDLTISGGTVNYSTAADNQIPDTVNVTMSSGTFTFGARTDTIGSTGVSGSFTMSGGSLTISSGRVNLDRNPTISGGTLSVTSDSGLLQADVGLTMNGGTIDLSGSTTNGAPLNLRGGTGTGITYDNTGTSAAVILGGSVSLNTAASASTVLNVTDVAGVPIELTIKSTITGAGKNLVKTGSGTVALTGGPSGGTPYTGATTNLAGTLIMNGTNTGSAVMVLAGATNMGVGSIGSLTLGGQVAPGTNTVGVGFLTVSSLVMSNGSSFRCQLGNFNDTTDRDYIYNTGAAPTINASATVYVDSSALSNFDYMQTKSWNIVTGNVASASNFTLDQSTYWDSGTFPRHGGLFSLSVANSNLVLNYAPFPDIVVLGTNSAVIADGETPPTVAKGTDFGNVSVNGFVATNTFTITNSGSGPLFVDTVAIGGTDATNFSVLAQPDTWVVSNMISPNADFETGNTGWNGPGANSEFRGEYYNVFPKRGTNMLTMWSNELCYRDFAVSTGTNYGFSVWVTTPTNDTLEGGVHGELKVEWKDSSGGDVGGALSKTFGTNGYDITIVPGKWFNYETNVVAPASAVSGRVVLVVWNWSTGGGRGIFDHLQFFQQPGLGITETFKIGFDPSAVGTRTATLYMTNNVTVKNPYDFTIQGTGTIAGINVSPATYAVGTLVGSSPADFTFGVTNVGSGTLNYNVTTGYSSGATGWATNSPGTGSLASTVGQQHTVKFGTTALSAGTYYVTNTITDVAASNSPKTVVITLNVTNPAATGIIYDWFPNSGRLYNQGGGNGWGTNLWVAANDDNQIYASGSFATNKWSIHDTAGNKAQIVATVNGSQHWADRYFATAFTSGTVYVSWLQNYDHKGNVATLTALAGVFLLATNGDEKPFIGKIPFTNALGIGYNGAAQTNSSRIMENGIGTDYVVVAKYDFATRILTANAYSTNDMVAEEPQGYWDISVTLTAGCISSIGGVRIKAGVDPGDAANNIGNAYFDEIRVGTNFYQIARSQGEANSDVLVDGPRPTLIFLGTNYTVGATNDATITDAQLVNTSDKLDFAIMWSNQYGVFMTNQNGSFSIGSRSGRVNPNWDPFSLAGSGVTNALNYDSNFTGFVGYNGALTVTTYVQNAFSITTSSVGDTYFLSASAENNNLNNGSIISPSSVSTVPVMRALTINSQMFFTVTDDDSAPPVLAPPALGMSLGTNLIGNLFSDPGFELPAASSPWVTFSLASCAISNGIGESGSSGMLLTIGVATNNYGGFFEDYTLKENISRRYIFAIRAKDGASHFDCSQLILKMEFFDVNGAVIYAASNDIVNQVTTDWQTFTLSATTTVNTVKVRPSVNFDTANGAVGTVGRSNMWDNAKLYWATEATTNPILRVTDGNLATASAATPFNVSINGYDAYSGLSRGTNNSTTQSFISVANLTTNNVTNYNPGASSAAATNGDGVSVWTWSNAIGAAAIQGFMDAGSNIVVTTLRDADADRTDDQLSISNRTAGFFAVVDDDTNIPQEGFTRTTELLANPGLESGGAGWSNYNDHQDNPLANSFSEFDAQAADTGSYGYMITNNGLVAFAYQNVPVTPGGSYILSVRARKSGVCSQSGFYLKAEYYDINGSPFCCGYWTEYNITSLLTTNWQTFTVNVTEPGNVYSNKIVMLQYNPSQADGQGAVFWDNVSFKAAVGPPMTMQVGNTLVTGSDDSTNATYSLTDGDLAGINATNPLRLILAAYDADSGLARTNVAGAEGTNTFVSVLNLTTNNVTNYASSESSTFPTTSTSSNIWRWDTVSAASVASMYSAGSNAVRTTLKDADFDRTGDQLSGPSNTLLGYLKFSDDDTTAPVLSGFYAAVSAPPGGSVLSAGDIAIIGYRSSDPDAFTFVTLTTLASGTVIKFTDNGWAAPSNVFRSGEGTLLWSNTAPNGLAFGAVVTVTNGNAAAGNQGASTGVANKVVNGHDLAATDQLIAYQDTATSTTFIYAVNWNGGVWQADAPDTSSSALPTGLTNGFTAIALSSTASNMYNMSTSAASKGLILQALGNTGNWTRVNVALPPAGSFSQFIQISDGNLYNGTWWIAGFVQDTGSGVHSNNIASGPDFGVNYDLWSPSNVMVFTDTIFQLEQADGGGKTWPTSIASSVSAVQQDVNSLGVWTVRVSAADNDNDRSSDRSVVLDTDVLTFNVIDDDTNAPVIANLLGQNLLSNSSFEVAGWWSGIASSWDNTNGLILGSVFGNYFRSDFRSHGGGYSGSIPGQYSGNPNNFGGWFQGVTNAYGNNVIWKGGAWAFADSTWTGACYIKIEFYATDNSTLLGSSASQFAIPSNRWAYVTVVATNTYTNGGFARLVINADNMGTNVASLYFDDASLQVATNTTLPMDVLIGDISYYRESAGVTGVFQVTDADLAQITPTSTLKFVFRAYDPTSGVARSKTQQYMNYDLGSLASALLTNIFNTYSDSLSSADTTLQTATSVFAHVTNFTIGGYHSGTNFVETGDVFSLLRATTNIVSLSVPNADDDRGAVDREWVIDNQVGYFVVQDEDTNGPVETLRYIGTDYVAGAINTTNLVTDADMLHSNVDFAYELVDASGIFVTNNSGFQTNDANYGNVSVNWDLLNPASNYVVQDLIHPATNIFAPFGNGSVYATAAQFNVSQVTYANNATGTWTIQVTAQDYDNDRGSISYNNQTVSWDRAIRLDVPMYFTVVDDDPDPPVVETTLFSQACGFNAYTTNNGPQGSGPRSNRIFSITDEELVGLATAPLHVVFNVWDGYSGVQRGSNDPSTNMNVTIENYATNNAASFNFAWSSAGTTVSNSTSQWIFSQQILGTSALMNLLMYSTSKVTINLPDADNDRVSDTLWKSNYQVGYISWDDDDTTPPRLRSFGSPTTNPALSLYVGGSPSLGFAGTNAWINPQTGGEISNRFMVFQVTDANLANVSTSAPLDLSIWFYDQENGLARDNVGATSNSALSIGSAIVSNVAGFVASNSAAFSSTKQIAQSSNLWRFTSIPYTQVSALYSAPGGSNQMVLHALNDDFDRGSIDQDRGDTNLGYLVVRDDDSNYPTAYSLTINSKALTNLFTDEEMSTGFYLQVHLGDDVSGVYTAATLGAFAPPTFSLLNASNNIVQTNTPFNVWSNNPQQLVNGGFETAGTNGLLADKWDWICYDTMGTWHRSNDMVRSGQYALSANFAGAATNEVVHQWVSVTNMAVGENLIFGGWLKMSNSLSPSSRAVVKMEWWDVRTTNTCPTPAGTLQGFDVGAWCTNTANDWTNLEVVGTKPTVSSYWCKVICELTVIGGATNRLAFDDMYAGTPADLLAARAGVTVPYTNFALGTYSFEWTGQDSDNDRTNDTLGYVLTTNMSHGGNQFTVIDDDTNVPVAVDLWANGADADTTNSHVSDQQVHIGLWPMTFRIWDYSGIVTNPTDGWVPNYSLINSLGVTVNANLGFATLTDGGTPGSATNIIAYKDMAGVVYSDVTTGSYQVVWSARDKDNDRADDWTASTNSGYFNSAFGTNQIFVYDDDTNGPSIPTNVAVDVTVWTNADLFSITFNAATDDYSGIHEYRYDTNTAPSTLVTDGVPITGVATTQLAVPASNLSYEVGQNGNVVPDDPGVSNSWQDFSSPNATGMWSSAEHHGGTNSMRHLIAAGDNAGSPRFDLVGQIVNIGNTNGYPVLASLSGWFKGDVSASANGSTGTAFLKMEFLDANSNKILVVDDEYGNDHNGSPLFGVNAAAWTNVMITATNGPASARYIRFLTGVGQHGTKLAYDTFWDDLVVTVRVIGAVGNAYSFTVTNVLEGIRTNSLFGVDDDDDRPNDRSKGLNTNFITKLDLTAPPKPTGLVATGGLDEATEIRLDWTAVADAGNRTSSDNAVLSPWRTYYVFYEECTNCAVTTNSTYSKSFTNGYPNLGTNTTTALTISNLNFDSTYRFVLAGQDTAGNLGALSSTVTLSTLNFIVTQGIVAASARVDISWLASSNNNTYDMLWVDGMGYSDSYSNLWTNLAGTVTNSFMADTGSGGRVNPQDLGGGTMRFYRVSREGQWATNATPRRGSKEIYLAKSYWLTPGENWISLPMLPDTNRTTVWQIFGTNRLPAGSTIGVATKMSWYGHTVGSATNAAGVATNVIWLSSAGRWLYSMPPQFAGQVADGWQVPTNEAFNVEIPTGSATQKFVVVGRLPTNEISTLIYGANGQTNYSTVCYAMPYRATLSQLQLKECGFSGGLSVARSDEIRILSNTNGMGSMQAPKARIWLNGSTTNFTYSLPLSGNANNHVIEPGEAIVIVRKRGPSMTWTNHLYYSVPGKNINP